MNHQVAHSSFLDQFLFTFCSYGVSGLNERRENVYTSFLPELDLQTHALPGYSRRCLYERMGSLLGLPTLP